MRGVDDIDALKTGTLVAGRYRVDCLLGSGGMGQVYRARHELIGQWVALKVLNERATTSRDAVQRFLNEARAAATIAGDHVVRIFDVGKHEGRPYICMECLQGEDLARRVERKGALPYRQVCSALLDATHALGQAHGMGIVHRDLKPSNLFLAEQPTGPAVLKVLDFGIAKMDSIDNDGRATATGTVMGTPSYMAPEQMRSSRSVDARADIWALGVIAYELLAAELPYPGGSIGDVLLSIVESKPKPLQELAPNVPFALVDVVMRCLRRNPEERYPDVAAFAEAIEPFSEGANEGRAMNVRTLLRSSAPPGPAAAAAVSRMELESAPTAPARDVQDGEASDAGFAAPADVPTARAMNRAVSTKRTFGQGVIGGLVIVAAGAAAWLLTHHAPSRSAAAMVEVTRAGARGAGDVTPAASVPASGSRSVAGAADAAALVQALPDTSAAASSAAASAASPASANSNAFDTPRGHGPTTRKPTSPAPNPAAHTSAPTSAPALLDNAKSFGP